MHPTSSDRVFGRHEPARPELQPGQIVTWKDVAGSGTRPHPHRQGSLFPRGRSPDRQRSLERRRRLAASGPMPPALAAHFTTGQLSVLRIVSDEMRRCGVCGLYIDEIAARAGVCRTTAQNAIREALRLGLLTREERRRRGQVSLTNLIHIVSREWKVWIDRRPGLNFLNTTGKVDLESGQARGKLARTGPPDGRERCMLET